MVNLAAILVLLAAAGPEAIGSWVLSCPSAEGCRLRTGQRFFDKAGITGDLEVMADGASLIPVLTLRGVSSELLIAAALNARPEASIQFGDGPAERLDCSPAAGLYLCSPRDDAARVLAAALPVARSVSVHVSVSVTGLKPMRVDTKSLGLSGTEQALVRLRTVGPPPLPGVMTALSSPPPGALVGIADRALKAAGYANGLADLKALVAKYRGR